MFKISDYIMDQIEALAKMISRIIFKQDRDPFAWDETVGVFSEEMFLHNQLERMMAQGDLNGAENHLYETMKKDPLNDYSRVGLWFYGKLSQMSDAALQSRNFSREEISDGLLELKSIIEEQKKLDEQGKLDDQVELDDQGKPKE